MSTWILEAIREMEGIYQQIEDPNLLGFLRRCPESAYYRRHCTHLPPMFPTDSEVRHSLNMARFNLNMRAKELLRKAS